MAETSWYGAAYGGDRYTPDAAGAVVPSASAPRPLILQAVAQSEAGTMRARFTPDPWPWLVHRITVQSDTLGTALVYVGEPAAENLVSGTFSGDFDENDASSPYLIPEGSPLIVEWPAGGICRARIEYREVLP